MEMEYTHNHEEHVIVDGVMMYRGHPLHTLIEDTAVAAFVKETDWSQRQPGVPHYEDGQLVDITRRTQ